MDFYHANANSIFKIHNPIGIKILNLQFGCPSEDKSIESVDLYPFHCPNHVCSP